MHIRMELFDLRDGGMRQMVVVRVRNHHEVDGWDIFDGTRHVGESLWSEKGKRRASWFKHRIEENAQSARELDVVAGMSQPCRA